MARSMCYKRWLQRPPFHVIQECHHTSSSSSNNSNNSNNNSNVMHTTVAIPLRGRDCFYSGMDVLEKEMGNESNETVDSENLATVTVKTLLQCQRRRIPVGYWLLQLSSKPTPKPRLILNQLLWRDYQVCESRSPGYWVLYMLLDVHITSPKTNNQGPDNREAPRHLYGHRTTTTI